MEKETSEGHRRPISGKTELPLDVRIVAWFFYLFGALGVFGGIFVWIGLVEFPGSARVFLGTVVLSSGPAIGIYCLVMGLCYVLCDWGLMRRKRFAWWLASALTVYQTADYVPKSPRYPVAATIILAGLIALLTWLWFRREFCGVHLAARRKT